MRNQEKLRTRTRIAIAENNEYTFKVIAEEVLNIKQFSFYNWLARKYNLSQNNYDILNNWLNDLLEQ